MALNHDQDGFLSGPKATGELEKIGREIEILKAIRADTENTVAMLGVIADALTAPASRLPEPATPHIPRSVDMSSDLERAIRRGMKGALSELELHGAAPESQRRPAANDAPAQAGQVAGLRPLSGLGDTPALSAPGPTPSSPKAVAPAQPGQVPAAVGAAAAPVSRVRASNGQFGSNREPARPGAGERDAKDESEGKAAKAMGVASESLRNATQGLGTSADNIDPTIQAMKEVSSVVSPVAAVIKPLGGLFGSRRRTPEDKRQRENVQWYRRIVNAVKGGGDKAGGMGLIGTLLLSVLGMLLAPIKALGRMLGALRGIAALGALFKGLGRLIGGRIGVPGRAGGRRGAPGAGNGSGKGRTGRRGPGARTPNGRGVGSANVPEGRNAGSSRGPGGRGTNSADRSNGRPRVGAPGAPEARTRPGSAATATGATGVTARARAADAAAARTAARVGSKGVLGKGLDLGKTLLGKGAGLGASLGKGLLKRIPFLGAALGLGMAASSVMADDDPTASPEEQQAAKADKWSSVGGAVGGIAGGLLGMVGGPAGAIAGGMLGDMLGTQFGEWLSGVDLGAMVSSVGSAISGLADSTTKAATNAFDFLKGAWSDMVGKGAQALTGLTDWAKEKWSAIGDLVDTAKETLSNGVTTVKDAGQNVLNTVTGGRYTGGSNARKDELIKAMDAGGITDPKSKAMLMANVDHESQGFTKNEENLNYSAKRLQEVFPKYYSNPADAARDAKNPEAIANKVYGGRMGNVDPGDGFKYRGRGDLQLTGRAQYAAMGKQLGVDLENNPDLAMDPKISAKIAVAHWKASGADAAASTGDVVRARRLTNGGTNGLDDVTKKYKDTYLAQATAGDLTPTRQANEVRIAAPAAASGAIASTMATIKGATGAPAVAGAAAVPGTPGAPGSAGGAPTFAGGVQPVGVLAMSTSAPAGAPGTVPVGTAMRVATAAPTSVPNLVTPSYSAPAADATKTTIPSTPVVAKPNIPVGKDSGPAPVKLTLPLTQNLEDRQIAHAANGGIGMGTGRPM